MHRERLPPSMTLAEFKEKFEHLTPGEELRYHIGHLGCDRPYNNDLDKIAEQALTLATNPGVEVRPYNGTGHEPWYPVRGSGQALLVQRRSGTDHEYLIVKRREKMPSLMLGVPKRHVVTH